MKLVSVIILAYTIYLNFLQTNLLRNVSSSNTTSSEVKSQLNMNIMCSYIFAVFLTILLFFVVKSFF
jgi:glucan phosphoethanolaminetransferase (alkaline phosphatase superfamily)